MDPFLGGFGPANVVAHIPTARLTYLMPAHALYFLTCIGLYYCLPEMVLFRQKPISVAQQADVFLVILLSMGLAGTFILFPPVRNVNYFTPRMGFLDIAANRILGQDARVVLFYFLALWAVVRFVKPRNTITGWLLITNALVMAKAQIAWDKYALPIIAVLWLLQAVGTEARQERARLAPIRKHTEGMVENKELAQEQNGIIAPLCFR